MHRVCLGKEMDNQQADIHVFQVHDLGNGYGRIEHSYGELESEKTRLITLPMPLDEAEALFDQHALELLDNGYIVMDERDYRSLPSSELKTGAWFLNRYRVDGILGSGGQGKVYLAEDMQMGRYVALKVLKRTGLSQPECARAEERFLQEKNFLAYLSEKHPAIPTIYDFQFVDDVPIMTMQFINGQSLEQKLQIKSPCPLPLACEIILKLCDVLTFLHSQEPPIVYRDLKPSNVMVDMNWNIYLIDFGIARFFDKKKRADTVAMGSPGYISPELLAGKQTTPRSDIYSLGALFHHLVTGEDPAESKDLFAFASTKKRFPDIGHALDAIIGKMTEKAPERRYASMEECAQAIEKLQKRADTKTVRATVPGGADKPAKKVLGTVFLVSASLLGSYQDERTALAEVQSILGRPIRDAGFHFWASLFAGPSSQQEKREQFLAQLKEATHVIVALTPEFVQSVEGKWIAEQILSSHKPIALVPLRTCHPTGMLARRRPVIQEFVSAARTQQQRKERLVCIRERILQSLGARERVA